MSFLDWIVYEDNEMTHWNLLKSSLCVLESEDVSEDSASSRRNQWAVNGRHHKNCVFSDSNFGAKMVSANFEGKDPGFKFWREGGIRRKCSGSARDERRERWMKWMFLTLHGNQRENTKDIVFANFDSRIQILAPRKNQPEKRGKIQESELAFGAGFDLESNDDTLDAKRRLKSGINTYIFPSALIPLCRKEQRRSNKLDYKNLRD